MRIRALVLCGGYGSRLRPLTYSLPKPLLPVAGRPLVAHTLERLAAAGCEATALNLFYLGEQIEQALGPSFRGMSLSYSYEEQRMGTLGAFVALRDFFRPADLILLVNGDTLCPWPFERLVRKHLASGAAATLLLERRPDPAEYGGGVGVDREGRLTSFSAGAEEHGEPVRRRVFAGAHALAPELLERVPDGPANIVPKLYQPLLEEGARLQTVSTSRRWHDLGTPGRYLEGVLDWVRGSWPGRLWRRDWVSSEARIAEEARLRRAVVEAEVRVEGSSRIRGSLVLPGAHLAPGCRLTEAIVGFGVELPPGSRIESRLVTRRRPDQPPHPGDSVVGDLVYTPLDHDRQSVRDGDLA